ncbi:class IV adenylate cyclase [Halococcus salsus]|uniref:class IV adenylate cyclase n=1 Tax=Halococcus salsus TaxID=2162894 RepID=UPI00135C2CCE|nr:class IV adenylate cyclase [Halococcus salsus]
MYEVELKVRTAHDPVRERLASLDAEPLGTVRQVDTYYDAPDRSFAETDEALRIRTESTDDDERTRVTYKGPLVEAASKTRIEHETGVGDREAMAGVFDGLGFSPAATVEKDRDRFSCGEYTVALDTIRGLGEFVEVEREVADESAVADARDGARELLTDLDCDPDTQIRTSYLGLLLDADADSPPTEDN